jgi:hypothetical protein
MEEEEHKFQKNDEEAEKDEELLTTCPKTGNCLCCEF